jgi:hypothetical protein
MTHYLSPNLYANIKVRQSFDTENKEHISWFKYFMENGKWQNGCPFYLEFPYLTIPDMIKDKLIKKYIDMMLKETV